MAIGRVSTGWVLAGTLGGVGCYWITVRLLRDAGLDGAALPYLAHALGGAVVGVSMSMHAPLRPWREPLFAGLLGVAVLALLVLALPSPSISWVAARSSHPWPAAFAVALLSAASACAGAVVVRRVTPVAPLGAASLLVLSGLVALGTMIVIAEIPVGMELGHESAFRVVGMLVGVFFSSYLTQSLTSRYRPWLCGSGMFLAALPFMSIRMGAAKLVDSALAFVVLVMVGAWGARVAWRRKVRDGAAVETEVPTARLQP